MRAVEERVARSGEVRLGTAVEKPGDSQGCPAQIPLRTERLSVGYRRCAVVDGVELALEPGRVTALIGPNGAGKSTVLKTIAGQLEPLGGAVWLDGRDLARVPSAERARLMASMFTERRATELLTCSDVVEMGRYPYTGRLGLLGEEDRAKVAEALALVNASELAGRDFMELSDGQRQRVLFARALCQEPRVLLLDEPTSYLDVRYQVELLGLVRRLARERGIAVVASLHELDMAQKVADEVVGIRDGRVFCHGTPEEVFTAQGVAALFDLDGVGSYDPLFGSVELAPAPGAPRVFVVAGGGSGTAAFRALQKEGVPFAAGVLHANDVDCAVACDLASALVCERAFEPIGDEALAAARGVLAGCEVLLLCLEGFGTLNARNAELVAAARELGLPVVRRWEDALAAVGD